MAQEMGAAGFISYSSLTQQNLKFLMDECAKVALLGGGNGQAKSGGHSGCIMS
jgi:hypothetical protein